MSKPFPVALLSVVFSTVSLAADEFYSEFSDFEAQTSLRAGYGYTENVLMGESVTVDSPFRYLGLEGVASLPFAGDQCSWDSLVYGDFRSYGKLQGVPDHSIVFLQTELDGYVGMIAKGRIGARYLNLTQVFDATFDEIERVDFVVEADKPEIFVGYETIIGEYGYDVELGASRMSFKDLDSDYDSLSLDVEVTRNLTDSLRWESEISAWKRFYDSRIARDLRGIQIEETLLETELFGFETGVVYEFSYNGVDHRVKMFAGYHDRSDAISGFYDRSRLKAELDWSFSAMGIDFDANGGYGKYEYDNQVGEDGLLKKSESWYWELEMERNLTENWSLFLSLASDEDESNESFATYDTQTALLGIRWK